MISTILLQTLQGAQQMRDAQIFIDHIKVLHEVSSSLITWAMSIFAGSILLITSTSYFRPAKLKIRLIYISFIPAWIFSFLSIYYGNEISKRVPAAVLAGKGGTKQLKILNGIAELTNCEYEYQLLYFQLALFFLSIWLILYLIWWIYTKQDFLKK